MAVDRPRPQPTTQKQVVPLRTSIFASFSFCPTGFRRIRKHSAMPLKWKPQPTSWGTGCRTFTLILFAEPPWWLPSKAGELDPDAAGNLHISSLGEIPNSSTGSTISPPFLSFSVSSFSCALVFFCFFGAVIEFMVWKMMWYFKPLKLLKCAGLNHSINMIVLSSVPKNGPLMYWWGLTESMTPCSASNPSLTGNTWSLLSAIFASWEGWKG